MHRLLATALASATLLAGAAHATTLTQTHTYGSQMTDFALPATFNLFDSTIGTLNVVTFSTSYGFTSTITLMSDTPSSGNVKTESLLGLSSGTQAINSVLTNLVDVNGTSGGAVTSAAFDLLGRGAAYSNFVGTRQVPSNATAVSSGPITDTAPADLAVFQTPGGGTFVVTASTFTQTDLSNTGGNTSANQNTQATATFTISYDYSVPTPPPTTVQEPASLVLLGAGLLAAGLIRRRA